MTPVDPTPLPRCADTARGRQDPLAGSAPPAPRWLLIEHPGPWHLTAMATAPIAGPVSVGLLEACAAHDARPTLIRRPGRQLPTDTWSWAVVDCRTGTSEWGTWSKSVDLLEAVDVLGRGLNPDVDGDTRRNQRDDTPLLLVCAHATHDVCCATRGRPVAAALAELWPENTWECSHLGGDRFAANVAVLPDGAVYGNLDEDLAVEAVKAHLDDRVRADLLRGITTEPPAMQAALVEAMREFGPCAIGDVEALHLESTGRDSWHAAIAGIGTVPARIEARVTRTWRPPARLTCRAAAPTDSAEYTVSDLRVLG